MFKQVKLALKGTWSDSDEEYSNANSSDEETSNLCLVAKEDEVQSMYNSSSDNDSNNDIYNDIL